MNRKLSIYIKNIYVVSLIYGVNLEFLKFDNDKLAQDWIMEQHGEEEKVKQEKT